MRIEHPLPPASPPPSRSSWDLFFDKFTMAPTDEQKQEMTKLFMQHLSHMIYRHMQRMVNAYKKMRYGE